MDTNKEYIKMCTKAEEIQGMWKEHLWDLVYMNYKAINKKCVGRITSINRNFKKENKNFKGMVCYIEVTDNTNINEVWATGKESLIWLPRQDQLQKIIDLPEHKLNKSYNLWFCLCEFILNEIYDEGKNLAPTDVFASMEQSWFAFVMKQNYKKVWNGEEWIMEKSDG